MRSSLYATLGISALCLLLIIIPNSIGENIGYHVIGQRNVSKNLRVQSMSTCFVKNKHEQSQTRSSCNILPHTRNILTEDPSQAQQQSKVHATLRSGPDPTIKCLDYHMLIRFKYNVQPLEHDEKLKKYAKRRVEQLQRDFSANHNSPYGENIAKASQPNVPCYSLVHDWYADEVDKYNFEDGDFSNETGHFTQMVWKATKRIGCAIKSSKKGTFLACIYDPPGNVVGEFQENVLKPKH